MRPVSSILFLIAAITVAGCTAPFSFSTQPGEPNHVTQVNDGDTIGTADGETVRLLDINTPEQGMLYHEAARNRLHELVYDKTVRLEPGGDLEDQYGRSLRYVWANDTLVNKVLVREGVATTYFVSDTGKYRGQLQQAEQAAQDEGRGLWEPGEAADCITASRFQADAPGNDNHRLNQEYITFQNTCSESVAMTGWTLKDDGTNIYTFPKTELSSEKTVTVRTGSGTDNATDRFWGSGTAVWNNGGDTAFLRDQNGELVAHQKYRGDRR